MSLDEGGAVLLAGSRRPCPLCGAGPEAQRDTHGLDEVEQTQRAVHVEIAKIRLEKSDLLKATNLLRAEQDRLVRRAPDSAGFPQTLTGTEAPVLALPLHSSRN
jgi:hypothetical protein